MFYDGFQSIYDKTRTSCISTFVVVHLCIDLSLRELTGHGTAAPGAWRRTHRVGAEDEGRRPSTCPRGHNTGETRASATLTAAKSRSMEQHRREDSGGAA
jgi:hypothetical protein